MNRGARRSEVFLDDEVRHLFLAVLSELPDRFGVRVHGYALMPNHYHLLLESVTAELPRAMRHLGGEFTRRLNLIHAWDGPVFRGRYRNRLVATDAYWRQLLLYVHLNPVRSNLTPTDAAAWTSHPAYLGVSSRPSWLTTDDLQALFGSMGAYLDDYTAQLHGEALPDAEFDPSRLWVPHSTGSVAVPDLHAPLWQLGDALAAVSRVTGQPLERLIHSPVGREGNPANWLAAWWMSRHCGISHGNIGKALGATHTTVSIRIRRVEDRRRVDSQFQSWIEALQKEKRDNT